MGLYQYADNGKKSGRWDGNVYMRNGRTRGMTVPSLVRNAYTSAARSNFSNGSSAAWAALSDEERISWNNATGIFVSDRFGMPVALKGKELYVRCFANCAMVGTTPPGIFPDLIPPSALSEFDIAADDSASSLILNFEATPIPANTHAIVYATPLKRPTIYRPAQSQYRLITSLPPATATAADVGTDYESKFGDIVAGARIFARIKMVDARSGFESARVDANTIVVP